ncbi:glycosyltransferase [Rubinisphaera sp.]|uniref:glycosyltransferase n=1 Tax=Rubinisphaera sp. TaxID=2024857 RepID=UPI0025CF2212|nr:glycosyltransferase [Rubinisphaera sp.]
MSSSPLRILYVIPTLDQSGAEKQLQLLATGLAGNDYEIRVVALNRGGYYEKQLNKAGIQVDILKKRFRIDPVTHFRLKKIIRDFQPDIVHSWLFAANSHVRMIHKRNSRWKCIVSERCVDSWKAGWQLQLDRRLIRSTHAMVVNSASVAEFYQQQGVPESLIRVINNGIDIPEKGSSVQADATRKSWRKRYGLPEDAYVVLSIGRLARQKRLDSLLWATHMLSLSEKNVHTVFAGDGPERERMSELIEKYEIEGWAHFLGHQNETDELFRNADAFWLGSDFEGQSNSLMEAMAWGLPVVVSDISPNRELVTDQMNGVIVPTEDSAAFAKAIRQFKNDPELAKKLGHSARQTMQEKFSVSQMIEEHKQLYESLTINIQTT